MSSKVEENARIIAKYYKELDTIPYENIVDMLMDEDNYYQIHFFDDYDALNDIHYNCVSILKNYNTSEKKEYLSVDQNPSDIYTNMVAALKEKGAVPYFQIIINDSGHDDLACTVGNNVLILPRKVLGELMQKSSEQYDKNTNYIPCFVGNREICFPSSLKNYEQVKKRIL